MFWLLIALLLTAAAGLAWMAFTSRPRPKPPPIDVWQAAALLRTRRGAITIIDRTDPGLHRVGMGRHTRKYLVARQARAALKN